MKFKGYRGRRYLVPLVLLLSMSSVVRADQSGDSFGTGFASALQRSLEARQQANTNEQYPTGHFDLIDNYGRTAGYQFATFTQCVRYMENSGGVYQGCVWVQ
jgi:hypothetical protein